MKPSKMATAKRKKLLADAIILQPKRSRKRSEKWDNNEKNMVEDTDFLKRSVNVAARRYMNILNKHGFSDHSVIKLTSFSSVQKQFSMTSAILKSHVVISPGNSRWKGEKIAGKANLANAREFNRRYLTCQISAILFADRSDWRKSQSWHRTHLAIYADRRDRCIKSPGVSPALVSYAIFRIFFELLP